MENEFNKERIEKLIKEVFPDSKIDSYKKLTGGLVHLNFKVKIKNPKKEIVVRISKLKRKQGVMKNNQAMIYLRKNNILTPEIFLEKVYYRKLITIMEFVTGKNAEDAYNESSENEKIQILENCGKALSEIHGLAIPNFWKHQKHEIKDGKEWIVWTFERIEKYLKFVKANLPQYYDFLKKELSEFYEILKDEKSIKFVPLHWDYHLANLNVGSDSKITGIFDFDNCMKGHNLSDLGQTKYWIMFRMEGNEKLKFFLDSYSDKLSSQDLKLIHGYFLLHLLAVTRTIWRRQPRLSWIIEDHKKILDDLMAVKFK
jgi:Ser/Thr protein kinase RdoA (MazF antagonist)